MTDREPNLFTAPISALCYCASGASGGASSCAPCRARRKAAEPLAIPLTLTRANAARMALLDDLAANDDGSEDYARKVRAWLTDPKVPYLTQRGDCRVQRKADYSAARAAKLVKANNAKAAHPATLIGYATHAATPKARAVAKHLGVPIEKYLDIVLDATAGRNGRWIDSNTFDNLRWWGSTEADDWVLYDHPASGLLLPGWASYHCDEYCASRGRSYPGGQSCDPCSYCTSNVYHPDTVTE